MENENTAPNFYKYLDVQGARLTLQNRTFKHAKPSDFNDTEDMTISSIFPERLEEALVIINDNFLDCLLKNKHKTPTCDSPMREQIMWLKQGLTTENLDTFKSELTKDALSSIYDMKRLSIFCSEFIGKINQVLQNWRIFCACEVRDSEEMWQKYAQKHEGLVLRIQSDLKKHSKFKSFKKVTYCPTRPPFYEDALSFLEGSLFGDQKMIVKNAFDKIIYTKTLDWKHEQEHRLAIPVYGHEPDWNTIPFHPNEISELYLGLNMSGDSKAEFIALAQKVNPEIKIFSTTKDHCKLVFNQI